MRLSTTDAFFVAYQADTGVQMHFGAEVEVAGPIARPELETAVAHALRRWPALGQTLHRGLLGLRWAGALQDVVHEAQAEGDVVRWRNRMIDPFREPPFQLLWLPRLLAFKCHHACADGQLFFAIVTEILCTLAGQPTRAPLDDSHPLALRTLWPKANLGAMWRHTRVLAREAKQDRSARIAVRACAPGDIATHTRIVEPRAIARRASAARVRPPWLVLAAWLHALREHNTRRGDSNSVFSVEVPVGLRRGPAAMAATGNHLSVLTLFGDPRAERGELARGLWRDYAGGVRRRAHLAVPLFSAPLGILPWPLFRRAAMTQTGFATTHFTWLAQERDPRAVIAIRDHRIYTPVCLRMGAALAVLAWRDELRLTITHRLAGLSSEEAAWLGDALVANLASSSG
jgi:hypothetical protein